MSCKMTMNHLAHFCTQPATQRWRVAMGAGGGGRRGRACTPRSRTHFWRDRSLTVFNYKFVDPNCHPTASPPQALEHCVSPSRSVAAPATYDCLAAGVAGCAAKETVVEVKSPGPPTSQQERTPFRQARTVAQRGTVKQGGLQGLAIPGMLDKGQGSIQNCLPRLWRGRRRHMKR